MLSATDIATPVNLRGQERPWAESLLATVLVWVGMVVCYLLMIASIPYVPYDGDDLMRLQQVRDLLAAMRTTPRCSNR